MLSSARIEIHDHLYNELHPRMADLHFFQKFVDSSDGKRRHALPGVYVSTHYTSAKLAFLIATAAALRVDPAAQVMLIAGDEIFSHGCREEEQSSIADFLAGLAALNSRSTSCTVPVSLGEGFASAMSQEKGAVLGSVPSSTPMPVPFGLGEYVESLTRRSK
jgi:hypothetical protein